VLAGAFVHRASGFLLAPEISTIVPITAVSSGVRLFLNSKTHMLNRLNSLLGNLFDVHRGANRERLVSGKSGVAGRRGRRRFSRKLENSAPRITEALEQRLLLTAGDLVQSFGVAGLQASDFTDANGFRDQATAVAVDAQGGTVVGGISGNNGLLLRYTATGELDTTFGVDGRLILGVFPGGLKTSRCWKQAADSLTEFWPLAAS